MKKIINLVISLSIATAIFAQFKGGIHTGVDFNTLHVSDLGKDLNEEIKYFNSARIGIHGEYKMNDKLSIKSELNHTQNGFRMSEGTSAKILSQSIPIGVEATTHLNYIEVPLLLKYSFGNKRLSYYAEAGPSASYGINGKIKSQATALLDFNLPEVNINFSDDPYRRVLVGANAGMGLSYQVKDDLDITATMRYTGSLTNLIQDQVIDLSVKSNTIHLGVGLSKSF